MAPYRSRPVALAAILGAALLAQLVVLRGYLDNGVVNAISPTSVDTTDYWQRALLTGDGQWAAAFGDAYRMPGYPVLLAAADLLTPAPLLAVRIAQLLAVLASAACVERVLNRVGTATAVSLTAAAAVAFYPPFWYLGPLLYAEAFTVLGVAVLLVLCSGVADRLPVGRAAALGATCAALTYLKPNNVVLVLAVGAFLLVRLGRTRAAAAGIAMVLGSCVLLLMPWSVAATASQDTPVLLSTNNGYTLYRGTGVWVPSSDSLPRTAALRLELVDGARDREIKIRGFGMARGAEADAYWRSEALAAWGREPWRTPIYALAKVGHALGLSLGGPADLLLLGTALLGLGAAIVLLQAKRHLDWLALTGAVTLAVVLQTALYVPDVRFRVSLLDLPVLLLTALAADAVVRRRARPPAPGDPASR